jgi:hypothetical protein
MEDARRVADLVGDAVSKFLHARDCLEETFGVRGASKVVADVLGGERERSGSCVGGLEYLVHGIGYTVVQPDGGQLHIDAGKDDRDVITVYDIQLFLETASPGVEVDVAEIEECCSVLAERWVLEALAPRRYALTGSR